MRNKQWCRRILAVILLILLTACGSQVPPLSVAPHGDLVKKAIALQLKLTEQAIAENLTTTDPEVKISTIKLGKIEPFYIGKLAVYHLQGTYNATLKLPKQEVRQKNNNFDVYLQRQAEGKTWRLLKKIIEDNNEEKNQWSSYLIQ